MRFALLLLCALTCASPVLGCSAPPTVTLAAFDRVQEGMTYEQVVAVIGHDGKEIARREGESGTIVQYRWDSADGANFVARFENGKLASKVHSGLK